MRKIKDTEQINLLINTNFPAQHSNVHITSLSVHSNTQGQMWTQLGHTLSAYFSLPSFAVDEICHKEPVIEIIIGGALQIYLLTWLTLEPKLCCFSQSFYLLFLPSHFFWGISHILNFVTSMSLLPLLPLFLTFCSLMIDLIVLRCMYDEKPTDLNYGVISNWALEEAKHIQKRKKKQCNRDTGRMILRL